MEKPFGPRAVDKWAPIRWAKCAVDLMERGIHPWIVFMIVVGLICFILEKSLVFSGLFLMTGLSIGILIAAGVDDSRLLTFSEILTIIVSNLKPVIMLSTILMAVYELYISACSLLFEPKLFFSFSDFYIAGPSHSIPPNRIFAPSSVAFTIVLLIWGMFPLDAWFIFPLVAFTKTTVWTAFKLNNRAFLLNSFQIGFSLFSGLTITVLLVITPYLSLLTPIVLVFVSAYTYVAFRDIFLGESKNRVLSAEQIRVRISQRLESPRIIGLD